MIVKIKKSKPTLALKNIICFDKVTEEMIQKAKDVDMRLYYLHDVMEEGRKHHDEVADLIKEPSPESCYMFCYTSGTTGDPKGVMISHSNFVSCAHLIE